MQKNKIAVVRFAPSPTGFLHMGGARTALFNYLFAKKNNGKFILRIEDTDIERSKPEYEKDIINSLKWLGLEWDEFFRQSERLDIYEEYLQRLFSQNKIFFCSHSKESLEKEKNEQIAKKLPLCHICSYRTSDIKMEGILRIKNDYKGKIIFNDIIRGEISVEAELLGDFSLAKSFREPLYNFTASLDDGLMKITHVIRGEDHISNTPKQLLVLKAFGFRPPQYAHLPLILGMDRSKLSKRHGAVSTIEYRKQGYLSETLINFLAFLGWHPEHEKEIYTIQELIQEFSLERVQKAGAIFDINKLNWLNKEHLKRKESKELAELLLPYLKPEWQKTAKQNPEFFEKIAELEKPRLAKLSDIAENIVFFFEEPGFNKELLSWKGKQDFKEIKIHLQKILELISQISEKEFTKEKIESAIMPYANEQGRGEVLWPFRVVLSGKKESPAPFEIAEILGKKEVIKRIKNAI